MLIWHNDWKEKFPTTVSEAGRAGNDNPLTNTRCMMEVSNLSLVLCMIMWARVCGWVYNRSILIAIPEWNNFMTRKQEKPEGSVKDWVFVALKFPAPRFIPEKVSPMFDLHLALACIPTINHEIRLLFLNKMQITTSGLTHSSHVWCKLVFYFQPATCNQSRDGTQCAASLKLDALIKNTAGNNLTTQAFYAL